MRKEEQFSSGKIGANFFVIQLGRGLIRNQNHDHIGPPGGFGNGSDFKAGLLCLGDGFGVGSQADLDLNAGVLEVESVGVPLRTVADDGHFFRLNQGKVSIVIVIGLCHFDFVSSFAIR